MISKKSLKWYDDYLSNQHFTRLIHSLRDLYQDNFRRRPTRNKIQYFWLVRPNIEKMVTVEQMYKDFAVLADAKDKAGEVKMPMPFYTFLQRRCTIRLFSIFTRIIVFFQSKIYYRVLKKNWSRSFNLQSRGRASSPWKFWNSRL